MKKQDFIDLGLDEEMAQKAAEASSKELDGFIPKSRFDSVNEAKKQAEKQVKDYEASLKDLKKSAKGNEALEAEIQKLQDEKKAEVEKYQSELNKLRIDTAIDLQFGDLPETKRKAAKAFIDRNKLELTDDGVKGLTEQVEEMKKSEDFGFIYGEEKKTLKGVNPGEPNKSGAQNEPLTLKDSIRQHYDKN